MGDETYPKDWEAELKQAYALASDDGRVWMNENRADSAFGPSTRPLWVDHSTSSFAPTQADKTLATFVHEAGHRYHEADAQLSWNNPGTAGGEKLTALYEDAKNNGHLITKYAGKNEKEYFAESFAAALLHPKELAKRDPAMYQFMKEFTAVKGIGKLK